MRAIKFYAICVLNLSAKRGLKFKSKISKLNLRFLKFKSEILKSAAPFAIPARSKPLRI